MSLTWEGRPTPPPPVLSFRDWLRVLRRGAGILGALILCFPLLLLLRLPERAIWGMARPVTPWITQGVCVWTCWCFGLRRTVSGLPMRGPGAYVANHSSWLDIFVLNASKRLYFVAKAEVSGWGGIGWLARGTGTLFIQRDRRQAAQHAQMLEDRLKAGHRLLFFPEGTSTDGRRVLPFRTTLFAPFLSDGLRDVLHIQPVSLVYTAPEGAAEAFYGWWGGMEFGSSLLEVLAAPKQGHVAVTYHAPLTVRHFPDRKTLAAAAEEAVRSAFSGEAR